VVAATLMTRTASIQTQYLRFHADPPTNVLVHSGAREFATVVLRTWPLPYQEDLGRTHVEGIVRLFSFVTRALVQSRDHSFIRSLGAYRVATAQARYVDGILHSFSWSATDEGSTCNPPSTGSAQNWS
jgi:hypothetical protein